MRIIKQSLRKQPRLSLILLDWGVRESFHLLHYLKDQTIGRDAFEVVLIEYYSGISDPLRKFESEVDTWILLEMPASCYYHKHLMYNVGIVFSHGDIVMIADSDAMVRPTFVETVLKRFECDPLLAYHMDEFRNVRRDLYPFNYPSFDEVLGDGSINNVNGKTKGILDAIDPMHSRNYGACMCARRQDLIAIGGADEDLTYLGHICGPYDMTFRLMNFERRLCWETEEYLYHTWHPGSDGIDNYLGPHDGRNMSTTAFQALCSGRIPPLVENQAIRLLRAGTHVDPTLAESRDILINPEYAERFNRVRLGGAAALASGPAKSSDELFAVYRGYDIYRIRDSFCAIPASMGGVDLSGESWRNDERVVPGRNFQDLRNLIDTYETHFLESIGSWNICRVGERFAIIPHALGPVNFLLQEHREKPTIVWADTVGEARQVVIDMAAAQNGSGSQIVQQQVQPEPQPVSDLQRQIVGLISMLSDESHQRHADVQVLREQVENLQKQLNAVESGLTGMIRSRTWRGLTAVGRLFMGGSGS